MPPHRQRSNVGEARIAGFAIMLSLAVLVLVLVYVVGGFTRRVVIQIVPVYESIGGPSASTN